MKHLSQDNKVTTFKLVLVPKIVHLALLTIWPETIIKELDEIQKSFYSKIKNVKWNMVDCVTLPKIGI